MKRNIFILLIALILLLSSCDKHNHSFGNTYSSDGSFHWYECSCGERSAEAEHVWNSGVVTLHPTTESEGERTFTCTVCREKKDRDN